ncbi:MAG: hypothetical protein K6A32_03535 [Bacteroidales bacterium]|nr:hypothetical protein [Bacteroidales bacterium]
MKKILILTLTLFTLFAFLVIVGNIIVIGEKMTAVVGTPYLEYAFYVLLAVLLLWLVYLAILQPMLRIHRAPEFPVLSVEENEGKLNEEVYRKRLTAFGNKLCDNCYYLPAARRGEHQEALRSELTRASASADINEVKNLLNNELKQRYSAVDKHIIAYGSKVFIITAVSSSNRLDTLATLGLNYRMIADIVRASGFRPNKLQLLKIYYYVISSAFLSYFFQSAADSVDDMLDGITDAQIDATDIDMTDMDVPDIDVPEVEIPDVDASNVDFTQYVKNLNLPGIPIAPLADGLANAVMTIAIGFITKHYLQRGSKELKGAKGRRVKLKAKMKALGQVPTLLVEIPKQIGNTGLAWAMKGFQKAYSKMAGQPVNTDEDAAAPSANGNQNASPLDDLDAITPDQVVPEEEQTPKKRKGIFSFWK